MSLGILIKKELKKKGITQKELSVNVGISETAMSQIITDTYFPSKENLCKICEKLKVKLIFSFEDESDKL